MNPTILVVDIGNTRTSLGLYRAGKVSKPTHLDGTIRNRRRMAAELKRLVADRPVAGAAIASVVPASNRMWGDVLAQVVGERPLWVSHELDLGVKVTYPHPETMGADRLANACGAVARYGAPVIVADFGTALTFDVVSRTRGYMGGLIAPGLPLMFSYLAEKTALLPLIDPGPVRHAVGTSTEEAMRLGARWGYRGMVQGILAHLRRQVGPGRLSLCATGGFAGWVVRGLKPAMKIDPDLTLFGIGKIHELNAPKKA